MNFKNVFKRETKVIAYVVCALTLVVIGSSYALFLQVDKNTNNQIVTAGSLRVEYSDGNIIASDDKGENACLIPQSDSKANSESCNYTLSISNTGTLPMKYDLLIYKFGEGELVDYGVIKYSLNRLSSNEGATTEKVASGFLGDITNKVEDKLVLDSFDIASGETLTYSLKIWISDTAEETIAGKYVSLKLGVSGNVFEDEANPGHAAS